MGELVNFPCRTLADADLTCIAGHVQLEHDIAGQLFPAERFYFLPDHDPAFQLPEVM